MRRFTILVCVTSALASAVAPFARADYAYGGFSGAGAPYYDHWRPWWGGLGGWGPNHGYSAYPAYRSAPTSGYRYRPCRYPPSSYYYGSSNFEGGYSQYPRTFVYDWSTNQGDEAPQPRTDAPPPQPYQAP